MAPPGCVDLPALIGICWMKLPGNFGFPVKKVQRDLVRVHCLLARPFRRGGEPVHDEAPRGLGARWHIRPTTNPLIKSGKLFRQQSHIDGFGPSGRRGAARLGGMKWKPPDAAASRVYTPTARFPPQ
jgi:hypothetical protein